MKGRRLVCAAAALALSACNDNGIVGMPADISASPGAVDFGEVAQQGDFGQTVIVTNVGEDKLTVTNVRIEPADAYGLVGVLPTSAAPWILTADQWKPLDIHFRPIAGGAVNATVFIDSDDPDEPTLAVPLQGLGVQLHTDSFVQGSQTGGIADILFIVDNSGSMADKQVILGNSFGTFINWLVGANVDYRIAVTTTDMVDPAQSGRFTGATKIITPQTPDAINTFKTNAQVGATGSGDEKGLAAAYAALTPPLVNAENAGFLRPEARLFVVYVTDEEDSSPMSVQTYVDGFTAIKGGDPSRVYHAAIAGPVPLGCFTFATSAVAGARYKQAVDATTGLFGSICETNFGVTLQNLAFEVSAASGEFFLTAVPQPTTLVITVNGQPQQAAWWGYNAASNSIVFYPPNVPAAGAIVNIAYEVAGP